MGVKKIAVTAVTEQVEEKTEINIVSPPEEPGIEQESSPDTAETDSPRPTEDHHEPQSLEQQASKPRLLSRLTLYVRSWVQWMKRRSRAITLLGVATVLVIAGVHLFVESTAKNDPLPKAVKQQAKFTLYYPGSGAGKYKYVADSSNYAADKLTYNLGDGGSLIHVSEQALSAQPPDLHQLQNFSVFQAPAGEAAVGANGNVLNGVLIAHKTLIILNGLGSVNMQDFIQTINSMKP